jgi:thiamine-monophosphate kinase
MDLSENELVAAIRRVLSGADPRVAVGVGDDAAVVRPGNGDVVLTADMLIEGVHFTRPLVSPRDLGYKSMIVNVSDIAAMAASPRHALISLGLPSDIDAAWVVELYGGLREAADEHAISIVGGDLNAGRAVVVSVFVTGEVAPGGAVRRSGARQGDSIVVTGTLGAAAGGLRLARSDLSLASNAWATPLLQAQARPAARVGEAGTLAQAGATSMIDLSDGLAMDLSRICVESGVGARVRLADVPVAAELAQLAAALNEGPEPLELALSGGEDYELLATLPRESVDGARHALRERFGVTLTAVGDIIPGESLIALEPDGDERPLEPRGWDHFGG